MPRRRPLDRQDVRARLRVRRRRRGGGRALTPSVAEQITAFLREIGIAVAAADLPESFLPGLEVEHGALLVDEKRLEYPGDLLHEAGHIAVAPPDVRSGLSGDIDDMPELEWAAIPWSYAAAVHIGIDPALVFHSGGYRGHSPGLLQNFRLGVPIGVHMLVDAGMTTAAMYPRMLRWLRAD